MSSSLIKSMSRPTTILRPLAFLKTPEEIRNHRRQVTADSGSSNCDRLRNAVNGAMIQALSLAEEGQLGDNYRIKTKFDPISKDCKCMKLLKAGLNRHNWSVSFTISPKINKIRLNTDQNKASFYFEEPHALETHKAPVPCPCS